LPARLHGEKGNYLTDKMPNVMFSGEREATVRCNK
jgi:hypothetical protein